ncbi:MAG TPA: putative quinol monooxygenase [Aquabacterium sp.]|nr:putative quinol monooxygenase [Aquabacterium sp.]
MHVLIVELNAKPEMRAELAALLERMTEVAGNEPGVVFYGVNQSRDARDHFVLCEMYEDEAAFNAHVQLPEIQLALAQFDSMLAEAPIIKRCDGLFATALQR